MLEEINSKRARPSSMEEEELDLPEVKKLREDLLENLEKLEEEELCSATADLDSFMKSFEEEISPVSITTENSIEFEDSISLPDLGYLLEASDDELGLPPSTASPSHLGDDEVAELVQVSSESCNSWGFDENITGYDSFDLGIGSEYVALDGLFDYSDVCFGSGDFVAEPETLPAQ